MGNSSVKATGQAVKRTKLPMTGWYDPSILITTAIRVAISTVFGQFADRREAIAASNAIEPQPVDSELDYSAAKGDFWFDYLADTGDGWNSTYAMARLVSEDAINVSGAEGLPRGQVLLLGGDQVYPFASKKDYDERFLGPFEEAYAPGGSKRWEEGTHDLYAIPGNHDWYDGLNAFFGLFCRRRVKPKAGIGFDRPGRIIAGRKTKQTRSYFALNLPGGWWLWATDAQLEGYIDQPQIDYFRHVARYWMPKGSKVILLVDGPSWAYVDPELPVGKFENFAYLERLAGVERDENGVNMGHRLKLVLTGDSHHYARFIEEDRHYVTCGGGGAFLHPTHQLSDKGFDWKYPPPSVDYDRDNPKPYRRNFRIAKSGSGDEALFPARRTSWLLSFWNLAFAALNWRFTATLFAAYCIFHWLLDFNARAATEEGAHDHAVELTRFGDVLRHGSFGDVLRQGSLLEAMASYWNLAFLSPAATILLFFAGAAYIYAADTKTWSSRAATGLVHAFAQAVVVSLTTCFVIRELLEPSPSLVEIPIAAAAAAVASATTYGIYLLTMLNAFKRHWNEGFSSFAHRGYKCMLRMRISRSGELTVYPVGLKKVPRDSGDPLKNPALEPHLIEGPITIR